MIEHVVGKAAVLQEAGHDVVPGAVEPGQADHHQRQDRLRGRAPSAMVAA